MYDTVRLCLCISSRCSFGIYLNIGIAFCYSCDHTILINHCNFRIEALPYQFLIKI